MTETIKLSIDGQPVTAQTGETIWQAARRQNIEIPHLCYSDAASYCDLPDGNCRACVVEIEGERALAASCRRQAAEGM